VPGGKTARQTEVLASIGVRRRAARDQLILDVNYGAERDARRSFSLTKEQARRLAEDILDVGDFEVVETKKIGGRR
jgi:hypothetical protein